MALPDFLTVAPSHFNWGIDIGTSKEFNALKLQLEEHFEYNPGVMTIEACLFQSFIYVSKYKDPKPDYVKGRQYLNKAYKEIEGIRNEEEKQGYLIVAKCNDAIMVQRMGEQPNMLAAEIQDLLSKKTDLSQACIDSVCAFALSRVGMRKYDEAKICYLKALKVQPDNTQWLFGLALVIGRRSRNRDGLDYSEEKEQERQLYQRIIKINKNHALAHAFLAYNLILKGAEGNAIWHAYKARELAPKHLHILVKVGIVLRRAGCLKGALPILQEGCSIGRQNSGLFHQLGLVYRDMYNEQNAKKKEAIQKKERFVPPDKSLLRKAIEYFTKALEANPTNNMAILDRARTYERLRMMKEAEDDFISALTTQGIDDNNKVAFNCCYALFFQHQQDEEKACKRFKIAIECAVQNCTSRPATRKTPVPEFNTVLKKDLDRAKEGYTVAMYKKTQANDINTRAEGLKGLAWLHQVLGEHDSARLKYEEYLGCDTKSTDDDVIYCLVKTLIQLEDFEEARRRIQELEELKKPDLVQQLTIECALVQGEEIQAQGNNKLAKELFKEAIECGSMDGCFKLADILIKHPDISGLEFRIDCAKILHCCEKNDQTDIPLYNEIKKLMKLEDTTYGKLRNYHLNLELAILGNPGTGVTRLILDKALQTIYEARSMLDRVMISFQKRHYPTVTGTCMFFNIQQEYNNQAKTEQQVRDETLKKLKKWDQFHTRFPDLLEFLVKLQSAYPGNTDNWYLALSQLANRDKHSELIRYSQYQIPVILNGKKGITPIFPRGMAVYGDSPVQLGQDSRVNYELVKVVDVASKAAIEVERIAAEFYTHM
ncbi:uncharacterized protein [Amphiura filiformis]|uniref:uncharacterized protein n=1 Tax=Amphiura filiformis TaxID=82378 RepID=UPI003B21EFF6